MLWTGWSRCRKLFLGRARNASLARRKPRQRLDSFRPAVETLEARTMLSGGPGPGYGTNLALTSSAPTVTAGAPLSLTVAVKDPNGNPATTFNGTIHFASTPSLPLGQLPGDYTFTASDLVASAMHTFSGVNLTNAGAFTITVSDIANILIPAS